MEIRNKLGSKKTEKSLEISVFLVFSRSDLNRPLNMAGAGGFEPATHGFGVDMGKRVTSRTLAFSELFGCLETMFENSNFN